MGLVMLGRRGKADPGRHPVRVAPEATENRFRVCQGAEIRAGLCGECALKVHVDATGNSYEGGRARGTLDVPAPRGWDNIQLPWQLDASAIL